MRHPRFRTPAADLRLEEQVESDSGEAQAGLANQSLGILKHLRLST